MAFMGLDQLTVERLIKVYEEYGPLGIYHVSDDLIEVYYSMIILCEGAKEETMDFTFHLTESLYKEGYRLPSDVIKSVDDTYNNPDYLKRCLHLFYSGESLDDISIEMCLKAIKEGKYDEHVEE